jgi:DNA invertase Pin-like site-specific DNA recombinase
MVFHEMQDSQDNVHPKTLIGYARVSTEDQNLDMQVDALIKAGCNPDLIFKEHASGIKTSRLEYCQMKKALRKGDVLVVYKMDRCLKAARARGRRGGRRPKLDKDKATQALNLLIDNPRLTHENVAKAMGVSRPTLYRTWKRYGMEAPDPQRFVA